MSQVEQFEALHRRMRRGEITIVLEMERTQVRRTAHQHNFQHCEAECYLILLRHRGYKACEFAAPVAGQWTAKQFDAAVRRAKRTGSDTGDEHAEFAPIGSVSLAS